MQQKIQALHIEPTNICTLKCAGCARTQFIQQWPQHWHNYNIDVDVLMNFLDIDLTGVEILLCGNYGDPIYYPDLFLLIDQLKQKNARISIVTNGSYKSTKWWHDLTSKLDTKDKIVFSIDGMPDTFTQYRKNANWESIKIGIDVAAKSRCYTEWKFIPFNYNEQHIDAAAKLSVDLGIDRFVINYSDRFDHHTDHLRPTSNHLGPRWTQQQDFKQGRSTIVNPKCSNGTEHFISAQGFYSSCCYVADHRFYYKTEFGKNRQQYKIDQTTLSEILNKPAVVEFYQTVNQQTACQYNCPGKLNEEPNNPN